VTLDKQNQVVTKWWWLGMRWNLGSTALSEFRQILISTQKVKEKHRSYLEYRLELIGYDCDKSIILYKTTGPAEIPLMTRMGEEIGTYLGLEVAVWDRSDGVPLQIFL
jgi:hypothetical protein